MRRLVPTLAIGLIICLLAVSGWADPPVVTIDANKNFVINGKPTFLIGTIGGDDWAWQTHLAPAGFNVRFMGDTSTPGAHSAGGWELPDVSANPSAIATMKNDPNYLMWDLGYEIDAKMWDPLQWVGYTPKDMVAKRLACLSYDNPTSPRPVGICWGNAHRYYGSESWGRDGYWQSYRHYSQLADYFIGGDYNWIDDQTVSHTIRMTHKPVIWTNRFWPIVDWSSPKWAHLEEMRTDIWQAVICGAKGIIMDRFECYDDEGHYYNWVQSLDMMYWDTIKKAMTEIRAIEPALLAPGDWMYQKQTSIEDPYWWQVMYTYRKYGNDVYMIAVNLHAYDPRSADIFCPVQHSDATGQVLFDYYATGAVMSNPTTTTFIDTSKRWTPNELVGHRLWIRHGNPEHDHYYPIASNTPNTITIASGDLLADGVVRGDYYKIIEIIKLNNYTFRLKLNGGDRKVIKFENTNYYPFARKSQPAVGTPSNRRWVQLMDYSDRMQESWYPVDAYGLCYDAGRHRLVAQGGLSDPYPGREKPSPTDPDVWMGPFLWEWDIDSNYYSGPIWQDTMPQGSPWPGGTYYHDMAYDPYRQCVVLLDRDMNICEWRGPDQGWTIINKPIPNTEMGPISHYAAYYDTAYRRFLIYGGKDWTEYGSQGRGMQFGYEWRNLLYAFDGTNWFNFKNPDANLPMSPLEEPVMCWDASRGIGLLFGLSHDGRYSRQANPQQYFQETPQQTYTIQIGSNAVRAYPVHVPYVYANYQMAMDPRTQTALLFGGLPSVNGKNTDLYEYDFTDWKRLDYHDDTLPAQDVMRIPTLTYDPDHQMVVFLDTRQGKIWGLTSGQETYVDSIDQALSLPNGTKVCIENNTVSRRFDGFFYMQNADRTSAIRVVSTSAAAVEGKTVTVLGTISTLPTGEKQIVAQVVGTGSQGQVRPLAMAAKSVGGIAEPGVPGAYGAVGANNVGLLVKLCGKVTHIGSNYIYVDDGSGASDGSGHRGIKVSLGSVTPPPPHSYVAVTGVAGLESISGHNAAVILVSSDQDLTVF